ncbi:MAG: hypothetical protein EA401_04200 [Planctomycetota bacterium]|nr:MAG: hypothetical protein EA401_04200 [Planctomycetota bacterium]
MHWSPLLILLSAVLVVACERPAPVTQVQAEAFADAMVTRQGEDWGRSRQARVLPSPDAQGRVWWQVIYRPGPEGQYRWMAVNRDTGWTRVGRGDPDVKYQRGLDAVDPADRQPQRWILLIDEIASDASADDVKKSWQELSQHAARRQEAALAHIPAAYGIRRSAHSYQLLWGWNDGAGTEIADEDRQALSRLHPEARWIPWTGDTVSPE